MTAFRIAVWIALAFGGLGLGTGVIQPKKGCGIDPNGNCLSSTGDTADAGSHIDPNGGS